MENVEELEKQLKELKKSNEDAWKMYGSELCAGDMIRQEQELENKIKILKEKNKCKII
jgi:hypothetical protein